MDFREKLEQFCSSAERSIMQRGAPWSQFLLLPVDHPQRNAIEQQLLAASQLRRLLQKLEQELTGLKVADQKPIDFRVYGTYYWRLRFLADIGLSGDTLGIGHLIRRLEWNQLEDGSFMIGYHARKRQPLNLVCVTAHLAYCLSRLDRPNSRAVWAACEHLLSSQRQDGGWHCGPTAHNAANSSCFGATITALMALGQIDSKPLTAVRSAIAFCLNFLQFRREPGCGYDAQHAFCSNKLRYPPHHTGGDIINIIRSLSFFPELIEPGVLQRLINAVIERWDGHHWLTSEKKIPEWAAFDFGQKGQPSDWLTALILSAIRRIYWAATANDY